MNVIKNSVRSIFAFSMRFLDLLWMRRPGPPAQSDCVLVYSPSIAGHRHIYAAKVIDYYIRRGLKVHFAYCGFAVAHNGTIGFSDKKSPYLEAYRTHKAVTFEQISNPYAPRANHLALIVSLQKRVGPRLTFFVDGDDLIRTFIRQLLPWQPKLYRNSYAVFILSEFFHLKSAITKNIRRDPERRRHLFRYIFHMLIFPNVDVLDGALHSDECFVNAMKSRKITHLPEIGHMRAEAEDSPEKQKFYERVAAQYRDFFNRHSKKEVVLLFGDLENRKGLGFLARLVLENPDLVLVRVGRTKPGYTPTWDIVFNKECLTVEGRLFEVDCYINSQELMDTLFGSVKYVLLPYQSYLRTSSVMVQALSYGKPLLVANTGLMGYRVRTHGVGLTYQNGNYDDFSRKFHELRENLDAFAPSIAAYYAREFSQEAFDAMLSNTLD